MRPIMDRRRSYLLKGLTVGTTMVLAAAHFLAPSGREVGDVLVRAMPVIVEPAYAKPAPAVRADESFADATIAAKTITALAAFKGAVRQLSHPAALEMAFRSYFAFAGENPDQVKKPFLYFVDYGLGSNQKRGYVFDMKALTIVDGPFTVAHGRGSSQSRAGIPTRFSNRHGSYATSLGLFLAQETYTFSGKAAGRRYTSMGLRLLGLSGNYNDNALSRRVVAHGAPYVTATKAGRSEGCPAIEPARAKQLLPKLSRGGLVFLFAPDKNWMRGDPWVAASRG
jgi:hypothetical protein